ncbi:uncharacterized protein EI97DRAFT_409825 [Westerdykella ornata]|uniref:T6SS Phospholipase effector Tle1-like catalytic domain-containing protein n=1 Tax=Westerdykella ornata TaxID=318751 RepID=A0A6A6JZD5_WESOR|nr:uncharacterized protein EI97DRAFT_409825 [Westerdykella ornata]KAF2281208.1 hypothetical protein EI97DRAFT_409825 [Westerdykella ornata]
MSDDKPWHRRIVICCDGTWQSSVSSTDNVPSNVTRLCRHIARIGTDRKDPTKKFNQIVYYDSGIGTGNLSSSERRRQGGIGAGLTENVIEAYNFIVLNYAPGDEIFCFGFSRGAYTARAVAGLVTDIGVINPVDMQVFPQIYRAYMTNDEGLPFRQTQAWKDFVYGKLSKRGEELGESGRDEGARERAQSWEIHPHGDLAVSQESRKVKVVGVWDTVGSLGIPDVAFLSFEKERTKYGFHNVRLNEHYEHAFHALALDERRKAFRPTLWYIPKELVDSGKPVPELKQVWFPGVHINCGGGSDDAITDMKGDLEHLSMATFCWMLQCIAPYLTIDPVAFDASMSRYLRWLNSIRYACTTVHPTWLTWAKSKVPNIPLINPREDSLAPPKRSPPHQHLDFDYGYGTGPIVDSYTGMYHLNGSVTRLPGHCELEIYDEESKELKLTDINGYGQTNEYIHPICHYRLLVRGLEKNSPLKDFTRTFEPTPGDATGKGRFWWTRQAGAGRTLPEWVILQDGDETVNFERQWYRKCEKSEETLRILKGKGVEGDWLEGLDQKVDFGVGEKEGWVYP